jgi:hypothetical protein
VTIRTVRHGADAVTLVAGETRIPLTHEHDGVWVGVWPHPEVPDYRLEVTRQDETYIVDDPYRHLPTLAEMDLYLIGEGRHANLWRVLGTRGAVRSCVVQARPDSPSPSSAAALGSSPGTRRSRFNHADQLMVGSLQGCMPTTAGRSAAALAV